jgi:lysophospholipase L1-like esterase
MRTFWLALSATVVTAFICVPTPASAAAVILWRVENPFRFFTDPADGEIHRATYRALGPEEKLVPVLSAERALQSRHDDGWAATMFRKTCWNKTTNRFSCPEYDDYMNPKSHTVVAEIHGIDEAANLTCTWLTAPIGGSEVRGKAVTQPCNDPLVLDVPYPGSTKLNVEIGGRDVAETDIKVRDIFVVGMGDSFASGEGNPDVPVRFSRDRTADYVKEGEQSELTGYPARVGDWLKIGDKSFIDENAKWVDQACHRSLYSQQLRAALQLGAEDPHRSVTYAGVACSGAEVTAGLFLRYKGNEWVPNPPELSQISAAAEAQCGKHEASPLDLPEAYHINGKIPELKGGLVLRKCAKDYARKIDLLFLSIGGNDIGFSRLVANAVLSNQSMLRQLGGWIGEVHGQAQASSQLNRVEPRYKSLNRAFHNLLYIPWDESDRIVLTGYPSLALFGDGSETCKDGRAGMEVFPDFQVSEQKLREGTWVADKLHRAMRDSASKYGWSFAETHRRQFIDRGICSGSSDDAAGGPNELRLPRKVDGAWKPYNPADFQAYATRQRWFRTPNDAFMTGNFHVATSVFQKVVKFDTYAWLQLLLASTYSGAFHPTAEGHAAIADAVADKARVVLRKYGQGPDPEPEIIEPMPAPPVDEPLVTAPATGPTTGPESGSTSSGNTTTGGTVR